MSTEEDAETSSGYQGTVGLLIMMSSTAIIGTFILYLLFLSGNMDWFPLMTKVSDVSMTPIRRSILGSSGLLTTYVPIFSLILVSFTLMTRLPPILSNPEKRNSLYNSLWHGVIPIGIVVFFALLVFRFLGGRLGNFTGGLQTSIMFIMVITGVIVTGLITKALVGTNNSPDKNAS